MMNRMPDRWEDLDPEFQKEASEKTTQKIWDGLRAMHPSVTEEQLELIFRETFKDTKKAKEMVRWAVHELYKERLQ